MAIHYKGKNPEYAYCGVWIGYLVVTKDKAKVSCMRCRYALGLRASPVMPLDARLNVPSPTPEIIVRYRDRKAREAKTKREYREHNWRIIDGLSEEEMNKLRRLMPSMRYSLEYAEEKEREKAEKE